MKRVHIREGGGSSGQLIKQEEQSQENGSENEEKLFSGMKRTLQCQRPGMRQQTRENLGATLRQHCLCRRRDLGQYLFESCW